MSEIAGDGFTLDPSAINLAMYNMGQGEAQLTDIIDRLRTLVIVAGYENWYDPYGDKLLGTIDALVTDLDTTLAGVKKLDVDLQKAANALLKGTESALRYSETASMDIGGSSAS